MGFPGPHAEKQSLPDSLKRSDLAGMMLWEYEQVQNRTSTPQLKAKQKPGVTH